MDNLVLLTVYFLDALGMKKGKMVLQGFLYLLQIEIQYHLCLLKFITLYHTLDFRLLVT